VAQYTTAPLDLIDIKHIKSISYEIIGTHPQQVKGIERFVAFAVHRMLRTDYNEQPI
jgi:hypothetical protein